MTIRQLFSALKNLNETEKVFGKEGNHTLFVDLGQIEGEKEFNSWNAFNCYITNELAKWFIEAVEKKDFDLCEDEYKGYVIAKANYGTEYEYFVRIYLN